MIALVPKAWGHEVVIHNGNGYCGKRLVLYQGWQCSLHRHLIKDETFYVQEGTVLLEHNDIKETLYCGDSRRIMPGVWHRFFGLTDAVMFEFSTTHEDQDVERKEISRRMDLESYSLTGRGGV